MCKQMTKMLHDRYYEKVHPRTYERIEEDQKFCLRGIKNVSSINESFIRELTRTMYLLCRGSASCTKKITGKKVETKRIFFFSRAWGRGVLGKVRKAEKIQNRGLT